MVGKELTYLEYHSYQSLKKKTKQKNLTSTFTSMHLADAFIQSNLHCISRFTFNQFLLSLGIKQESW